MPTEFIDLERSTLLYAPLTHLITGLISKGKLSDSFALCMNPELFNQLSLGLYLPKPFVQYGNYDFTICHLTNIEMRKNGKLVFVFADENEILLTHLAVEGDFLFALRLDGKIIKWNYRTGTRLGEIDTAYSKGNEKFKRGRRIFPEYETAFCSEFYVKNGYIVISYHWSDSIITKPKKLLEMISYKDPTQNQLIEDSSLTIGFKIILEKDYIILMGRHAIWIRNLLTQEAKKYKLARGIRWLDDMSLNQHMLYVIDPNAKGYLHRIDLKTKAVSSTSHSFKHSIEQCVVIKNLLFGFSAAHSQIIVVDLRLGNVVSEFSWDFNHSEWRTDLFKELIKIAKGTIDLSFKPERIEESHSKCIIA